MRIPTGNGPRGITSQAEIQTGQTQMATNLFSLATDMYVQYNNQKDSSDLQEAQNQRLKQINDWKAENYKKQGSDAMGITKSYMEKSKEIDSSLMTNLSPRAQKMYNNWATKAGEDDRLSVMMYEQKQDMEVKKSRFGEGITLAGEMVRQNPKNYKTAFQHLDQTLQNGLDSGLIKPEEIEQYKTEQSNKLRSEMSKSYYSADKHDFIKKMNAGEFGLGDGEKGFWNEKYKDDLRAEQRELKSLHAEDMRLIMDRQKDFEAIAVEKEDTSHFFENAKKLRSYGYADQARELERQGKLYDEVIGFRSKNKNASLAEKINAAQNIKLPDSVDGSGIKYESKQTILKEMKKEAQIFNSDPAQYVSGFAIGETPEQMASSRINLQKTQGFIPEKGFRILTNQEQSNYKNAFEAGDERQKVELLNNLEKYGKHSSKVISELGLNRTLAFSPMFTNPRDKELLVNAATSKPVNLSPDIKPTDYNADAQDSKMFRTLAKVQSRFPTDSNLSNTLKDMQEVMVNVSMKMQDTKAGPKLFDRNFNTEEDSDKIIYAPSSLDMDDVISTLDQKKKQISESISTGNKAYDTQARWAVRDYTWINTPGGFALADQKTGRVVPGSSVGYDEVKNGLSKPKTRKELIAGE